MATKRKLKVKDLYDILCPFQNIQIWNAKTAEPWGERDYMADSSCDITSYEEYDVYGLAPKIDKSGNPYLAILVDLNV